VKRPLRSLLVALTAASLLLPTVAVAADGDDPAGPTPTPERSGPPTSVAVLGDSISAGTGADGGGQAGLPGAERPENSWATGGSATLDSVWQRVDALPDHAAERFNLSENGRRATHILGQVQGSPEDIGYILIQIGGNDLCRSSVAEMTPTEEYRQQIDAALAWIDEHRPEALVQINAVPDIYRLWEIRRTNFVAIIFWGLGIVPCQSLLASPTSTSAANMARRAQVRERGLEYNAELRDACAQYLRCRYDDDATWLFSNDPTQFVNGDISNQDHFHPSFQGQRKLAQVSWDAGFDFTDTLAPSVAFALDPAPTGAGWHDGDVEVTITATDDEGGVAGLEWRVFTADEPAGGWQTAFGDEASTTVSGEGVTYVEARAVDGNGNLSASAIQAVRIDETDPTITLDLPEDGSEVLLNEELTVAFACDDALSGVASCTGTQDDGDLLDTATVGLTTFRVNAVDHAGNTAEVEVTYRVVYAFAPAADRVDVDEPLEIRRNAVLPVRISLADAVGAEVQGLAPELVLVDEDGDRLPAGALAYDPVEDRYAAQVSLRLLGATPGAHDLVVDLDDGTSRTVVRLLVR
jgi:lysophospholipase L1-like esterase